MKLFKTEYDPERDRTKSWYWDEGEEKIHIKYTDHSTDDLMQENRDLANASKNKAFKGDKRFFRYARIPLALIVKWKKDLGLDVFASNNPEQEKLLIKTLEDRDYRYLKTTDGKLLHARKRRL